MRKGQHWERSPAHQTCRTYVIRGTSDSGSLGVGAPQGVLSPVSSDRSALEHLVHHSNLPARTTRFASGHHAVTRADEPNAADRAMPSSRLQFRNSTATCVNAGGAAGNRNRCCARQYGRSAAGSFRFGPVQYPSLPAVCFRVLTASRVGVSNSSPSGACPDRSRYMHHSTQRAGSRARRRPCMTRVSARYRVPGRSAPSVGGRSG
jgi:hypothetical protein